MNQLLVYLSVNAGLLAMFACLWALYRQPSKGSGAAIGPQQAVL
jgi:hypothetical protein